MVLLRRENVHAFAYVPAEVRQRDRRRQAVGVTVRARARHRWRYLTLTAYWPRIDLRMGRGMAAMEAVTWLQDEAGNRLTRKAFVRLKVGLGGRR